jgi:hypothetical protein
MRAISTPLLFTRTIKDGFEQHIIQNFTHVIKPKPMCLTHTLPNDYDSGSSTINSVWYIILAISKQTENELPVLKRTEAEEEKGKDDGDDDNDVSIKQTFGLQPAAHYGFRHLFIYFETLMLVLCLSCPMFIYTN